MTWHDDPPTVAGEYYLKHRQNGGEFFAEFCDTYWRTNRLELPETIASEYQFGPRIPSAEELVELQQKAAKWDETRAAWGMR